MITNITYNGNHFKLVNTKNVRPAKNVFTIIVGKNGTGKSRLLGQIASEFIQRLNPHSQKKYFETDLFGEGYSTFSHQPSKLIAVSTSPFDKFPLSKVGKDNELIKYRYLGLRELMTRNFGLSYMSKIIGSLIEVIKERPSQIEEITRVLEYLGYSDRIEIRMESRVNNRFVLEILRLHNAKEALSLLENQARTPYSTFNRAFFLNEDGSVSKKKVDHLIKTLKRIKESSGSEIRLANLTITRHGIHTIHHYPEYIDDIIFLHKCGVLKLRETTLSKLTSYVPFSISDASSGEQSVVISVLGIASQIEDNSIICIDEPEICLHPEWQERYIKILTTTFSMYSGCHFIIATHSPQIVSNLDPVNSYILSLETGETTDAREYIKHSSDFQLVNVFNSPGFRNEYLSRIALNVFAKASKNKTFDDEDISNYNVLLSQRRLLSTDDPVYQLFNAINEMYQTYGRH